MNRSSQPPVVRAMRDDDIPAVLAIQAECYATHLNEREAVVRRRLAAAPDTAWIGVCAGEPIAYLVAYRSQLGKITRLGNDFEQSIERDCLYLHDLAVSRRARGQGAASTLAHAARRFAENARLPHLALVSVQESRSFWEALGYRACEKLTQDQRCALASYQTPSHYMIRRLGA